MTEHVANGLDHSHEPTLGVSHRRAHDVHMALVPLGIEVHMRHRDGVALVEHGGQGTASALDPAWFGAAVRDLVAVATDDLGFGESRAFQERFVDHQDFVVAPDDQDLVANGVDEGPANRQPGWLEGDRYLGIPCEDGHAGRRRGRRQRRHWRCADGCGFRALTPSIPGRDRRVGRTSWLARAEPAGSLFMYPFRFVVPATNV